MDKKPTHNRSGGFGSDAELKALKPKDKPYEARYTKAPGLCVRVSIRGTKTLYFRYVLNSKRKTIHIGQYPAWTLKEASTMAMAWRVEVLRSQCPATRLKNEKAAKKAPSIESDEALTAPAPSNAGTLGDALALYVADMERGDKRSVVAVRAAFDKEFQPLPVAKRRAANVNVRDLIVAIRSIEERSPSMAKKSLTYLRAAVRFASTVENHTYWSSPEVWPKGRIKSFKGFAELHTQLAGITLETGKEPAGKRVLTEKEIANIWERAENEKRLLPLQILLATGQRVEEVLGMTRSEVDLDKKVWVIPGSRRKNTQRNTSLQDHVVPLCDLQIGLIDRAMENSPSDTMMFPHRYSMRKPATAAWLSGLVKALQGDETENRFVPRDCRRTFKTFGGGAGLSLEIRNRLQGHAMTDVGSVHYDRYDYLDEKRDAMGIYTAWLKRVVNSED